MVSSEVVWRVVERVVEILCRVDVQEEKTMKWWSEGLGWLVRWLSVRGGLVELARID